MELDGKQKSYILVNTLDNEVDKEHLEWYEFPMRNSNYCEYFLRNEFSMHKLTQYCEQSLRKEFSMHKLSQYCEYSLCNTYIRTVL